MNPLLENFSTKYQTVPFSLIKPEHFIPALKEGIKQAKVNIAKIKSNSEPANFMNTFAELEFSDMNLSQTSSIFFNTYSANTNDELKEIAKDFSPLLSSYSNDVLLDNDLFKKLQEAYENCKNEDLSDEQKRLVEKTYKSFKRNGALLNTEDKDELRKIDEELSTLSLAFQDNVLSSTNEYELLITDESELDGLPKMFMEAASELAKNKDKTGWMFNLQAPSYFPVLKFCKNRELRETLMKATCTIGYKEPYNNIENIKKILTQRSKRAKVLGYETHADFILEERMAEKKENVLSFLNRLRDVAMPFAKNDIEEVKKFAKETDGITDFKRWDYTYYLELMKKKNFDLDEQKIRPYLQLEKVLQGAFLTAGKLYGIKFEEINDVDKYHEDVTIYEVQESNGDVIGLLYTDFFPRESKRSGAWMTEYRSQYKRDGKEYIPHVSIVCNFSKPTADSPSLLNFAEATTLFHEFGHALHGLLSNCHYPSLSGANVYWDFVELPSQIMENWVYEKECLDLFATHYKTNEPIPVDLIQKVKKVGVFHEAVATMRQLSFAEIDMFWHTSDPAEIKDFRKIEKEVFSKTSLLEFIEDSSFSCAFGHIFSGGYSAGYYSYKWAEVLDADAFEYFKEKGIFDKSTGEKFRTEILSKGGTKPPMELYKKFRGKEPDVNALLRRAGLH